MLVADVGKFTALPAGNRIDMVQHIAIDFRLPLPDGCDEPEPSWRYPHFLLGLTHKRLLEALAFLDASADGIPMAWPNLFRRRAQAEKHLAVLADEQCPYRFGDLLLHCE
jgi:hypothetical protein